MNPLPTTPKISVFVGAVNGGRWLVGALHGLDQRDVEDLPAIPLHHYGCSLAAIRKVLRVGNRDVAAAGRPKATRAKGACVQQVDELVMGHSLILWVSDHPRAMFVLTWYHFESIAQEFFSSSPEDWSERNTGSLVRLQVSLARALLTFW